MVATTATTTPFDAKDVNDQVNKTISQDGLLMRMAKAKGEQYAAGRGLSNSSIGAEASQRAIVDAALPIASQNAGQAWKSDENRIDRSHQLTMQGNQFGHEKGMAELQYKNSLGLLDAEGQQRLKELGVQSQYQKERDQLLHQNSLGLLDAEGQQRLKELGVQSQYQKERDQLLHKNSLGMLDAEGQQRLKELDIQNKQQMDVINKNNQASMDQLAQQVVANTHGMYMSAIDTAMSSYNERYAALMADSTIKTADKTTMLENMKNELNSTLTMYQQIYSNINTIKPDWTKFPTTSLPGVKVS
ncbi:hypothetical protein ACV1CV_02760 [Aeromonas veronii]